MGAFDGLEAAVGRVEQTMANLRQQIRDLVSENQRHRQAAEHHCLRAEKMRDVLIIIEQDQRIPPWIKGIASKGLVAVEGRRYNDDRADQGEPSA